MFFAASLSSLSEVHLHLEQTVWQPLKLIQPNFHLGWDLFLALIPFAIALIIFHPSRKLPKVLNWSLLLVFVAFLPNAPYVLTDVIHLIDRIRVTPALPVWATSLLLVEFSLYFFIGMQSFTVSLMLWERKLKQQHYTWLILPIEWLMILLSAFGMYLGRFDHFNSWDLVTDPEKLMDHSLREAISLQPQMVTLFFVAVVALIFYLTKMTNIMVANLLHPLSENHPTESPEQAVGGPKSPFTIPNSVSRT
jgi:uncharacterized membrane protein